MTEWDIDPCPNCGADLVCEWISVSVSWNSDDDVESEVECPSCGRDITDADANDGPAAGQECSRCGDDAVFWFRGGDEIFYACVDDECIRYARSSADISSIERGER